MGELIEAPGADQSACDRGASINGLERIGDDTSLDQIDHAVADHSGVNAQVTAIVQQAQDRVRNRADPDL